MGFWNLLFPLESFTAHGCDGAYDLIQVVMIIDVVGLTEESQV